MSTMSPESQGQNNDTGTGTDPGIQSPIQQPSGENNPPYWDQLQQVPEALRPTVEPVFKEWDRKTSERFQQQAQQLNRYEPYNDIIQQYGPDDVQMAIQFATALRDNPEQVLQQLASSMGYDFDDEDLEGLDSEDPSSEKLQALEEGLSNFFEQYEQDKQLSAQQAEEVEIMDFLSAVDEANAEKYGPLDERALKLILTQAAADNDLEGAVEWYYKEVAKPVGTVNPTETPQVLGAGGSLPTQTQELNKLNRKQTEELVVGMLQAANRQE